MRGHALARRAVACALVLLTGLAFGAAPCSAADASAAASPRTLSLTAAGLKAIATLDIVPETRRAVAAQEGAPAEDAGSFFRTKKGVAVILIGGAGLAYGLYSKFHDRIKSPARG